MGNRSTNRRRFIKGALLGTAAGAVINGSGQGKEGPSAKDSRAASPSMGSTFSVPEQRRFETLIRYIPWDVDYEMYRDESDYCQVERAVDYAPELSALVLLDIWDWEQGPQYRERHAQIVRERIRPVAEACRQSGFLVVHAPSPPVALKYPRFRFWPAEKWKQPPIYAQPQTIKGWPAPEMQARKGPFKPYSLRLIPDAPSLSEETLYRRYLIQRALGPEKGDYVISTREELHELLAHKKRFHLFYAGFVSNGCILERDYGVRQMSYLGYDIILLRDCTTALEMAHTLPNMEQTQASIHNLELWYCTSTSDAFLRGLREMRSA